MSNKNSRSNDTSYENYYSNANYFSEANYCSNANYYSNANYLSEANYYSNANYFSEANCNSNANYHSKFNKSCNGVDRSCFCIGLNGISFMLFNTQVTEKRAMEFNRNLPSWLPDFTNYKVIKDDLGSRSVNKLPVEKAYNSMTKEFLDYVTSCPEFDADIFKEITGVGVDAEKVIVIDGKEIKISTESYEAFKRQFN